MSWFFRTGVEPLVLGTLLGILTTALALYRFELGLPVNFHRLRWMAASFVLVGAWATASERMPLVLAQAGFTSSPESTWKLIDKGGLVAVLVLFGVAMVRGWLVPKWTYDKLEARLTTDTVPKWVYDKLETDCKRMTEIALRNAELAERSTAVAEKTVSKKDA